MEQCRVTWAEHHRVKYVCGGDLSGPSYGTYGARRMGCGHFLLRKQKCERTHAILIPPHAPVTAAFYAPCFWEDISGTTNPQ